MLMVTKIGRMVTYHEGHLPIKPPDCLTKWPCNITWETKSPTISPNDLSVTWSSDVTLQLNILYQSGDLPWGASTKPFNVTRSTATKRDRVVANPKDLSPTKLQYILRMWSCDVPWQIRYVVSPLAEILWVQNSAVF